MAPTSGKQFPIGARFGVVYELNSNGRPKATGTTVYEGIGFEGYNAFDLNVPDARRIVHPGEDRVMAVDFLPSNEPVSGEIRVSKYNIGLNALLTNVKSFTVAEMTAMPWATDQQGNEPQVGLLLFQQSLDDSTKIRRWRTIIVPSTRCLPIIPGMSDTQANVRYSLALSPITKHLWGVTLTLATEGAEEMGFVEGMTQYKPWLANFMGNSVATVFNFSANKQAADVATIYVAKNGVEVTSGITKAVTGVTFTTAPASGDDVNVFYQTVK